MVAFEPIQLLAAGGVLGFLLLTASGYAAWRARGDAAALRETLRGTAVERNQYQADLQRREVELLNAHRDITRLHEALERASLAAEGSEGQWRSLAEHAPGLILVVDREGNILFANRMPPGIEGPHPLGASLWRIVPPEQQKGLREVLGEVVLRGESASLELALPGAAPTWWLLRLGPLRRGDETVGAVLIATDVTDLKHAMAERHAADERRAAMARLEELNQQRTQLLDLAAHELSNPLQAIQLQFALLQMVGLQGLQDRQRNAIDVMKRNFRRLRMLVQDMRDMTRIQSGKLRIQPAPLDLAEVAAEAAESFQEPAKEAGLTLEARVGDPVPVEADGDRVAQVLYNLVSNALKFTPRGGLVVVEAERLPTKAVIRVRDTGRGLLPEQMAKLFRPFTQVHSPTEVKEKGTGLGLYICKNLIEAHGGSIAVSSDGPGQGTTFTVELPLAAQVATPPAAAVAPMAKAA